MIALMGAISDKPQWEQKIFDERVVKKWKAEAVSEEGDFSETMFKMVRRSIYFFENYDRQSADPT